ncbi:MAG: hypothetical protein QOH23_601 [Gaiellaceae bacterium]|jgi:hypothetical protein|nr:hypothetical protein [Gaiellaceae bacterium]
MFDLRYHVASLAAVFFALVIGILVGVALASHGLGNTERNRLEEDLRRAESQSESLNATVDALTTRGKSEHAYVEATYKNIMANRLKGKRIALLFVGSADSHMRAFVARALGDAGAGQPLRIRALSVPIDATKLEQRLAKHPALAGYQGVDQLKNLGHALGQEFVVGTETPLWNALQNLIVEETVGPAKRPVDGVVIVRTVEPQNDPTASFLQGLYAGLADAGVPAVGAEQSSDDASVIGVFKNAGLSTVDDIDTPIGRLALVALLSDPLLKGSFGTKESAQSPLPTPIAPVTATAGG